MRFTVICLTHFKGNPFYLNAELIKSVEATPDTVITLVDESKVMVQETPHEVARRVIEYRRALLARRYEPHSAGV